MFLDITVRTQPIVAGCVWFDTPPASSKQKSMKARAATFPLNPSTSLRYHAERQTVIDWLNIELEGLVAEVAEPEDKPDGREGSAARQRRMRPALVGVLVAHVVLMIL